MSSSGRPNGSGELTVHDCIKMRVKLFHYLLLVNIFCSLIVGNVTKTIILQIFYSRSDTVFPHYFLDLFSDLRGKICQLQLLSEIMFSCLFEL